MPEADWGLKHTCQECGAKYYDMGRSPISCPLCGATLIEKPVLARSAPLPSNEPATKPKENEEKLEEEIEEEDSEEILPDDDVLPELEVGNDDEQQEEELSSVIEETKTGSET